MKLLDDLARTAIAPALLAQVRALFEQQQAELEQRQTQLEQQQAALAQRDASLNRQATVLAEKDFKITVLTHELAYYRRNRFGKASEALTGEQSRLFEDTVDADLAAIEEELERQAAARQRASVLDARRYRQNCRALNTATSRHPVCVASAAPTWSRSAKISANSWTWNRRASSCTAIFVRSTPAAPARR